MKYNRSRNMIRKYSYYTMYNNKMCWLYDSSYDISERWILDYDKEYFDNGHYHNIPGTRILVIERKTDILAVAWNESSCKWEVNDEFSF